MLNIERMMKVALWLSVILLMVDLDGTSGQDSKTENECSFHNETSHSIVNLKKHLEVILPENIFEEYPQALSVIENTMKYEMEEKFHLEEELAIHRSGFTSDSLVAFSAETTSNKSIGHNGIITFDLVITNISNHFIPLAGLFQCPDDDLYFAMWSLQALSGRIAASLVMEGETVKFGPISSEVPGYPSGTASMSTVLKCSSGDFVWLKAESWPDSAACNSMQAVFSTFSMFKIPVIDEDVGVNVAFTAELSQNTTVVEGTDIIFDSVLFDIGDNYDPNKGEFVCKENGIHVVVFGGHIASSSSYTYLYQNNALEFYGPLLYNTWPEVDDSGTSAITRLVRCEAGDVITIRSGSSREYLEHVTFISSFALPSQDLVAFSAQLSPNTDILNGITIPFDIVSINEGGRFTPVHGAFGCLDDAYYVFTWTIVSYNEANQRPISARLMMGVEEVKTGPQTIRPPSTTNHISASTQVVVQCKNATSVYLQAVVVDSEKQTLHYWFTDFSGFRLAPGDDVTE